MDAGTAPPVSIVLGLELSVAVSFRACWKSTIHTTYCTFFFFPTKKIVAHYSFLGPLVPTNTKAFVFDRLFYSQMRTSKFSDFLFCDVLGLIDISIEIILKPVISPSCQIYCIY